MAEIRRLTEEQFIQMMKTRKNIRWFETEEYFIIRQINVGEAVEITCDSTTEYKKTISRCTVIRNHLAEDGCSYRIIQDTANKIIIVKRDK